ncbi:MAG: hypothetical protein AB8B64_17325 [Granulosicoccus sp.]
MVKPVLRTVYARVNSTTRYSIKDGHTIKRVDDNEQYLKEQFTRQQNTNDSALFEFEKALRDDENSFNKVRKLLATCYRFRVVDANG